jgi:hypothetical protein
MPSNWKRVLALTAEGRFFLARFTVFRPRMDFLGFQHVIVWPLEPARVREAVTIATAEAIAAGRVVELLRLPAALRAGNHHRSPPKYGLVVSSKTE